jgi:glycosyltransferase involved in cell wall biosynthesis
MAKLVTGRPLIYNGVTAMVDELPSYGCMPNFLARSIGKMLDWVVPRMSNVIMVLSDELKDYLVGLGNPTDKVIVVPPGVEMEWLSSGVGSRARKKLGIDNDIPLVLYTGALEAFQRIDYLLQAMSLVCDEESQSILVIAATVNNSKALKDYRSMTVELGIEDRVIFAESVTLDELPDYLDAATVTVVPRPSCPGYPIKLLNYMAASKPVVSFAGSAKSLVHGYSGYIAADDDVPDLAKGISLLIRNPEIGKVLGERARKSLEGIFDWETIANGVVEVYLQLIKNQKKLSRQALSKHLKSSYMPVLEDKIMVSDFVVDGQLVYPVFPKSG